MLLRFEVGNYRSIKGRAVLDFRASSDAEHRDENTVELNGERVLRSIGLYGANGSGKSNVIRALDFMTYFTFFSVVGQTDEAIDVSPFLLTAENENAPSFFEIEILTGQARYRYGFEVSQSAVLTEWLFSATSSREAELFTREGMAIACNPNSFREGRELIERTRPNALFLTVCAQFNGEIASRIMRAMRAFRTFSSSAMDRNIVRATARRLSDPEFHARALEMLAAVDFPIRNLRVEQPSVDVTDLPAAVVKRVPPPGAIKTTHRIYSADNKHIGEREFNLLDAESGGTIRFVGMMAPIIEGLRSGSVVVIDELDARLHPLMTRFLVKLFHSTTNSRNAQLLFATHDVNLLSNRYFRRDQIWFTEKDEFEATHLYSLAEYRIDGEKVRKDASFAKDYLLGKFGAVPFIADFMLPLQPEANDQLNLSDQSWASGLSPDA